MKIIIAFVFLFLAKVISAQNVDVVHYLYSIGVNDRNDSIYGSAAIIFKNTTDKTEVQFDLSSVNFEGRGMYIDSIMDAREKKLGFKQGDQKVIVFLTEALKDTAQIILINYRGIPTDGLIISKNKYGDRTFFGDNWPNRAHHWIPCNDRPADKASFEFYVTAPSHYQVISNGVKGEEKEVGDRIKRTHWKEETPQPTKVMVIGVAKFATKTFADSPKDIPISAWVYPQDSTKGFYDYALTPEIVKFFSNYIAPYPYKKLANVQSKTIFGGMENASAIFYAESSVTGDRSEEDLMAHEIAHQWFGDMASEKSFAHVWLSEGFATYLTNLYWEAKYGKEAMQERLKKDREEVIAFAKTSTHAVVDSTKDLMSLLNANSYQKGGWVLHMLRNEVGDTTFQKIIQTYYNQYKGGNADTRDFEAVAEKVSGKELTWFFDQWLYQPEIPKLKFVKTKTKEGVKLIVTQLQEPVFNLRLSLLVGQKRESVILKLSKKIESVVIGTDSYHSAVIDPNVSLLFEEIKK